MARSAQLLHPASRLSELGDESVPLDALCDIAAGLARVERSVPPSESAGPRSMRLIGTPAYDVWLITWPPGTALAQHDHGRSTSVLQVVSGSLVEVQAGGGGARILRPGCASTLVPPAFHELWNPEPGEVTSVHVYSPPLEAVGYPSGAAGARVRAVAGVVAEASSPGDRC